MNETAQRHYRRMDAQRLLGRALVIFVGALWAFIGLIIGSALL